MSFLAGAVVAVTMMGSAKQVSVQAEEPSSETASFKCVLVHTEELQSDASLGAADVTVCHRPLHDDEFPVLHNPEPIPEEFEVFNDMVEGPLPGGKSDWQQAMALISLY